MAERAADHVGAVLGQGKFAGDAANTIGSEKLSRLICHARLITLKRLLLFSVHPWRRQFFPP